MKKRVLAAMSGGVDSSVAAALLLKQGYEVIGATMQIWPKEDCGSHDNRACCSLEGIEDARRVATTLGIPFYVMNLIEEFKKDVVDYFCASYKEGNTPNPCIMCNQKVKFGHLLNKAKALDCDYIATGHYAGIGYDQSSGRYIIKEAADKNKDQSYFLFSLTQDQLSYTLFPLSGLTKQEVRNIAKDMSLSTSEKPESQDICFVVNGDYSDFLRKREGDCFIPGEITDKSGKVLGTHNGIAFFTIGQRKGIGVPFGKPVYVLNIDKASNRIIVGDKEDIYKSELIADDLNWVSVRNLPGDMKAKVKIRYNHEKADAEISFIDDKSVKVKFAESQPAITRGQATVFYDGDIILGGGWIK